jgi:hypothetical protein
MDNNYYVSATNYGWGPDSIGDRTDIVNWPEWFTGSTSDDILDAVFNGFDQNIGDFGSWPRLASDPGGENTIVLFKSCFPNSDLFGEPDDEALDEPDGQYTVGNAKAVYNDLLNYFAMRTDKLFVVITAPPQLENAYAADYQTAEHRAANARALNNWLVNEWLSDYPHANVGVFDYFNVLTGTNNHHRIAGGAIEHVNAGGNNFAFYPSDTWDSHPSTTGHTKATTEFVPLLNYFYNRWMSGSVDNGDDADDDGSGEDSGDDDSGDEPEGDDSIDDGQEPDADDGNSGTDDDEDTGSTEDDAQLDVPGDDSSSDGGGGGGGCFINTVLLRCERELK